MKEWFRQVPLFQSLDEQQLDSVMSLCKSKKYAAHTVLFHERDPGSDFYILRKGLIKIYTTNKNGEEKILSTLKAGESFGELSLLDGKPRSASASTLEESLLYILPGSEFINLLKSDFALTQKMMQELCRRLRETNQHVHDLTFLDARSRVLKNLILLANRHGLRSGHQIVIRTNLNDEELSRMAGVNRKDLTEVLYELETKQIITIGQNEFTLDLSRLRS